MPRKLLVFTHSPLESIDSLTWHIRSLLQLTCLWKGTFQNSMQAVLLSLTQQAFQMRLTGGLRAMSPPSKIKVNAVHAGHSVPRVLWRERTKKLATIWGLWVNRTWWTVSTQRGTDATAGQADDVILANFWPHFVFWTLHVFSFFRSLSNFSYWGDLVSVGFFEVCRQDSVGKNGFLVIDGLSN